MNKLKAILAWLFFLLFCAEFCTAQQYDKVWAMGSPISLMTFEGDSVVLSDIQDSTTLSFLTMGSTCDANGNFLFYSNGLAVYNKYGNIMLNGDSLSFPSEYYDQMEPQGAPSREGVVILPAPGDTNLYYIFHYVPTDTILATGGYMPLYLYYSVVDMRLDSGRGAVVSKNNQIIEYNLLSFSRMAACRHANGRDWWIIKNAFDLNIYYEFLLTPDGVQGPFFQSLGPFYGNSEEQPAYAAFSPDGSKYASVAGTSDVVLMDFDRCTGLFSNPTSFYNNQYPTNANSISGGVSLAFSPSGRFLYVTCPNVLNQYDLSLLPDFDSVRIQTDTEFYQMDMMQQAPNGKIYVSCWAGGSYAMHVINQPDSLGLACDFQMFGQPELSQSPINLPYFPNFRLGAIAGSPCDTLTEIQAIAAAHRVFAQIMPNPASNSASLIYYSNGSKVNAVNIYNNLGELVLTKTDQTNSGRIDLDISRLVPGIYMVRFTADGNALLNTKLVIER